MASIHRQNLHFYVTAAFCIFLAPAAYYAHLLPESSFSSTGPFLFSWLFQSIIWAAVLYQFGVPASWAAYRHNSLRLLVAIPLGIGSIAYFGPMQGMEVAVVVFTLAEFYFRKGSWKRAADTLWPWLYLALGISVALFYSSIIVTFRPCTAYDAALSHLDSLVLFGGSVIRWSNAAALLLIPAEYVYYSIGGVMGATLLFLCLAGDKRTAFRFSGAILIAYFMSLVIFCIFPAQGPFVDASLPQNLMTASIQHASLTNATILYHHVGWINPPRAYYVAFPSMHLAQPSIAAWYLRRWRGVSCIVGAYCALLVVAIVILRWHYAVDILGGLVLAGLAVWVVSATDQRKIAQPHYQQ